MSSNYGDVKGKKAIAPAMEEPPRRPLRPLSPDEITQIEERRRLVHQHQPELVPMIKEWQEGGLIDGWRSVVEVKIMKEGADESATEMVR